MLLRSATRHVLSQSQLRQHPRRAPEKPHPPRARAAGCPSPGRAGPRAPRGARTHRVALREPLDQCPARLARQRPSHLSAGAARRAEQSA